MPLISVCIPAYKRVNYLKRLLDSLLAQTFYDFEVIVSDDSNDDSVENLVTDYKNKFAISYFKNPDALGTPANWNAVISKASGDWIKLIHDDDWFASPQALQVFADHIANNNKFIFCAYENFNNDNNISKGQLHLSPFWKTRIINNPVTLMANNVVGPPSVTMFHRSITEQYDTRMKWRVDMDFYIRVLLQEQAYTYVETVLINIGIGETQVTNVCFENPLVELPEGLLLLQKYGTNRLKNIWVYDAWWRLLRNMNIRSEEQLKVYANELWPAAIIKMIRHLNKIPGKFLKIGVLSKAFMLFSYLINRRIV